MYYLGHHQKSEGLCTRETIKRAKALIECIDFDDPDEVIAWYIMLLHHLIDGNDFQHICEVYEEMKEMASNPIINKNEALKSHFNIFFVGVRHIHKDYGRKSLVDYDEICART